jgi:hypothetical protein
MSDGHQIAMQLSLVGTGTRPSTAAHGRQLHGSLKITVVRRACRLGEQATKILG